MKFKDLKVGDKVFIREDLNDDNFGEYGGVRYYEPRKVGVQKITAIDSAKETFRIAADRLSLRYVYSSDMIDWNKTKKLKLNKRLENIKREVEEDVFEVIKRETKKIKIKWKPELTDDFYWIDEDLKIIKSCWIGSSIDKELLGYGNCFKTKQEALKILKKLKK